MDIHGELLEICFFMRRATATFKRDGGTAIIPLLQTCLDETRKVLEELRSRKIDEEEGSR